MKVLIIGTGGREHALAWKVSQSPQVEEIFVAMGNGGTASFCTNVNIPPDNMERLADFAMEKNIDLTIVGPEEPLCNGIVDLFQKKGLKIFGPNKKAAQFEKSKRFTKEFLKKYHIPTAKYQNFNSYQKALEGLQEFSYPLVIKADGLCLGKGVLICQEEAEAIRALDSIFIEKIFGEEGREVVIEEFLTGYESSLLCFVSHNKIYPMETAKDHKQIYDGDQGPNTGGVGAYSPGIANGPEVEEEILKILRQIEKGLNDEHHDYTGILFIGFMTDRQPKVLEFNVRFGDPETEVILPRLKGDFVEILQKALQGNLVEEDLQWQDGYCLTTVLTSGGYPGAYEKHKKIQGIKDVDPEILLFHNGTLATEEGLFTNGGRVLSVTAFGENLEEARKKVYRNIEKISFDGMYYRKDIGNGSKSLSTCNEEL
ncbi:MAG: phosphoribosylamine--glycine ligase [Tissierellia bacterium]|nr:phosphoribosylamine--glycine ligase [Tissierellia bacterium]